ncbi:MAG: hypothetical protein CO031_01625 [Candidatus Nealsonbacteria bacterium CG_4_9_14_0_2_um_filter_37_38]|uniref:Uncharacterized protein n=1 Tax=Candidatus Nealsonbacteria bacterium CG_4_10_14_0_8_um_filter_37_14 TaxID=1974684 RepID=A0A2M7R5B7_9BACT|nr:MAG: hypothetical protein COZ89_02795 [Candidatus Nealsonbacteria bacterium CG_4_8_14_3_um_filter_37_23]PIY88491.1 MAG: hypothetical protein COY73_03640 [Candidatus Nealsonbacteria bacterium CG_4_10_14_0_8_um_filter_37_14]PJC51623.1 MAG: hypothetical protein CO031_01625 [Candidatus Nealsonbacteria bacterium CG_4_9_14_0_2_um_filter_37_38]
MEKPTQKINPPDSQVISKPAPVINVNKPPLALIHDVQKVEKVYRHSDLEGIYRLRIGKRKGLEVWIVDGAKVRRELYTDFLFGGNDQRYKFIPEDEIWIDNSISVEELEFTIIHEITEREFMKQGMSYAKAHELATQEELRARINKTESIDELKDRWYKTRESKPQEPRPQEIKTLGVNEGVRDRTKQEPPVCNTK